MPKSVTLAVRVPQEIRHLLEDKVVSEGFRSLTDLLRTVLTGFAQDEAKKNGEQPSVTSAKVLRESNQAEACKHDDNTVGHVEICPVLSFARVKLCNACPYREQPVVSREDANNFLSLSLSSLIKRIEEEGVPRHFRVLPTVRYYPVLSTETVFHLVGYSPRVVSFSRGKHHGC